MATVKTYTTVYISACLEGNSDKANDIATQQLGYILTNYGYNWTKVLGRYNGKTEESYAITTDEVNVNDIASIASMFRQECILVDRAGYGFLVDCTGKKPTKDYCIGRRRQGTTVPDISQDCTLYPEDGIYVRYL